MAEWLPANWRQALKRLRDDIMNALNRWLPRRRREEGEAGPLYREEWLPPTFFSGGPLVDVGETDEDLVVLAELPGLDKDDFQVEVSERRVVIRGEKKHCAEERGQGYYYSERSYGAFSRAVALPCEIVPEKARAQYKNGLLRIALPKTERAKAKRVWIRVA